MPSPLQLDRRFRWGVYAVFALLVATGTVWIVADRLKDSDNGEFWQAVAANQLMIHGGAAMVTLVMVGALIPIHMLRAWRGRLNVVTGIAMATVNVVLVVTAFGLYYLGSETLRPIISDIHIVSGFVIAPLFIFHVWFGRQRTKDLHGGRT